MPNELYLVRLIHHLTRQAFPGERLWTAAQLAGAATVRFVRARNCEGCDIYVQPFAGDRNPGYVLVDLDSARPSKQFYTKLFFYNTVVLGADFRARNGHVRRRGILRDTL